MRTTLSIAALAVGALAVPYNKRDVVYTDWDIQYVTDVVTVTAGQAPPTSAVAPAPETTTTSSAVVAQHYGHHGWSAAGPWSSAWATTWTEVYTPPAATSTPAPSSVEEPMTTSTPPPPPPPSTTSTPVVQIPVTTWIPTSIAPVYTPPASSSAAPSSSGSSGATDSYSQAVVNSHNLHRANHSSPDIAWDDDLYTIAMSIAQTCTYKHNTTAGGGGYGQNIAAGVDSANIDSVITDMFYNGEEPVFAADGCYGQANPPMGNFDAWGHFSQVVWAGSTHVACYTSTAQDCPNGLFDSSGNPLGSDIPAFFTVCNYKDPGNFGGEYAANIGYPLGQAPVYAGSS